MRLLMYLVEFLQRVLDRVRWKGIVSAPTDRGR